MTADRKKPVLLCILDGWGCRDEAQDNAIAEAETPNFERITQKYPTSKLSTSGLDVGLPDGQMGNSEVGHMNIGSGRIVMQDLPRIDKAITDGSLKDNAEVKSLITALKEQNKTCHLMGLLSDGGVHAHIDHIIGLAKIISGAGVNVNIHAFLDGRDTPPESAKNYLEELETKIADDSLITISTISGRYYAMDRDNRWERVELAYNALTAGKGENSNNVREAIEKSYEGKTSDEFVIPTVIADYQGMEDGDAILMANFRADRARQILDALTNPDFSGFNREKTISFSYKLGMVEYSEHLNQFVKTIFPAEKLDNVIGQIISENGLAQLRIAETEKYAHVTFFLNGGIEKEFPMEDRILIPSPSVATYDQKPDMSANEVTDKLVDAINSEKYDFIVVNYANTDMVGHTGIMPAAKEAVEAVDNALGRLEEAVNNKGGIMLITADHGNAELMVDYENNGPHTAHTTNPVPFVVIGANDNFTLNDGKLCDIAPTILNLMDLKQPGEMSGNNLIG